MAGVFDKNKCDLIPNLRSKFPGYAFCSIPADDVRTKEGGNGRDPIYGLLDENGALRPEYVEETSVLFNDLVGRLRENTRVGSGSAK